ncbi:uncharacterized protein LOC106478279 [Limulus polyphemus]|uniref:Uncharacterized protein LOC106478279 n=1 Tax=Limulus polyphemus TaxID=6850 RepID=A0ABM1S1R4_LIMPO|nr:uncharacterized protein LOC106478279 [Limulus polyphemus]XP_022237569.1 uncharacterized protein LOC106478279 [Limulus polyphemus]XP_022237570.1 uncharacterized protein LOC106478279 [Limulus polyphemus]XP_022237571.1 uncharacterized protein LOC106478279 [Limulus polyphemus]XP_022237572.1 uncharacterized protein LOC106478279 [Limulus polyphemus]
MDDFLANNKMLMKQQSLNASHVIFSLRRRLREQDQLIIHLCSERDRVIREILSSLLFIEGELRKEQKEIVSILKEKDRIIQKTQKELEYWRTRFIYHENQGTWENSATPISENQMSQLIQNSLAQYVNDKPDPLKKSDANSSCNNDELFINELSAIDTVEYTTSDTEEVKHKIDSTETSLAQSNEFLKQNIESETEGLSDAESIVDYYLDQQPQELDNFEKDQAKSKLSRRRYLLHGSYERLTDIGQMGEKLLSNQFKRILSNHRSVVRPRDVKYKKISRSRTQAFEELKSKLRHISEPRL